MDSCEHAVPPDSYWDRKNHIQPFNGKQIFRDGPRTWTYSGITQAPGKCVNMDSAPSKSSETGLPASLYSDNDHCRIVLVPKVPIPGGSVKLITAVNNAQYQFKSSYDKPAEEQQKKK